MKLQIGRDGRDHLHQFVVENRRAQLQRNGHAGAIYFSKNVVRKVGLDVDILNARERVCGVRLIVIFAKYVYGVVSSQTVLEIPSK